MTYPQHLRAVLVLGLPLIGSHIAQFAVHLVDTIMLGWYGVEALAASVLATSFYHVIFVPGAGFGFAVMPMVAQAAADGDGIRVRRVTRMGMWLSVLFALALLPVLFWSAPLLRRAGQDPELAELAQGYLRIAGFGLFPALLVVVLKSYLAALERATPILWITLIAVVVNGGLNYALIFGNLGAPEMGLRGAALASVLTQILTLIAMAAFVIYADGTREHTIFVRIWRSDWEAFGEVLRLGWPIGLTNLAESGMFAASALVMGLIGTLELAAHGIALQIAGLTFMLHLGLSQAATVRVGRAVGRGDQNSLRLGARAALMVSIVLVGLTMLVFLGVPDLLMSIFIRPDDPNRAQIITIGIGLLAVAAVFQLMDAGQVMLLGLLRGLPDTLVPMAMAGFSYWIMGIPASYLIGVVFGFGAIGVWVGLVVGLAVATALLGWRWYHHLKRLQRT